MTQQQMEVKVLVGKHIVLNIIEGDDSMWWKALINGEKDRMLLAIEDCLRAMPDFPIPKTVDDLTDLVYRNTMSVRAAIMKEFGLFS